MKYLIVLLINLTCICGIFAQNNVLKPQSGTLAIQLRDLCGESIDKAVIQVEGFKIKRKFKSNKEGKIDTSLPIGNYTISVKKYGFKQYTVIDVRVTANSEKAITLNMEAGYASDDPNIPDTRKCLAATPSKSINE